MVTPRRGKAVEINALWYNALRLLEGWLARGGDGDGAAQLGEHAEQARDVVQRALLVRAEAATSTTSSTASSGDDPACRPNQLLRDLAAAPGARPARAGQPVLDVVRERLLTPVGLRSLAPGHPDYKPTYYGDLRARDAAYHQGTVWALADRPVRRRLAEGASRATARGARQLPRRASSPHLERGLRRLDQRDLRRRGAVHAARLHRPGLERRRGAAGLAEMPRDIAGIGLAAQYRKLARRESVADDQRIIMTGLFRDRDSAERA